METLLKNKKSVGVIICRMQVPYLTDSHMSMVNTILNRHHRVIMFLGTTNKQIDSKNPYAFEFRKTMVELHFRGIGQLTIVPFPDNEDNPTWVTTLDNFISAFLSYDEDAILYGGRDSFIPWYQKDGGKFECVELDPVDYDSGTQLRQLEAIKLPSYSKESAVAILWALRQVEK